MRVPVLGGDPAIVTSGVTGLAGIDSAGNLYWWDAESVRNDGSYRDFTNLIRSPR
jgi:hypothetical protein